MKRLIAVLAVVMVLAALLSGCGDKKGGGADTSKEVKLIYYTPGDATKDHDKVVAALNKYLKEKINATVEIRLVNLADYTKKMNTIASSGEKYDLAFTCGWAFDYRNGVARGYFADIDDLLGKYGTGVKKAVNPLFWEGTAVNGKHYAVPCNKEVAAIPVYAFNENLTRKFGVDVGSIKKLDDLLPVYAKVHAADPQMICFDGGYRYNGYDFVIDANTPGCVKTEGNDLKVINQFEDPEFLKIIATFRKFYEDGYISKDPIKNGGELFKAGKLFSDIRDANPGADALYSADAGFPVKTVPLYDYEIATTTSVSGSMVAISSTSDNPERAMMFLELVNTDPYVRNLLAYGIEGVNYKKIGDNQIEKLNNDYGMMNFTLGNFFICYTIKGQPTDLWQQFEKFNSNVKKSPILGFAFDVTPVKNEFAAVTNVGQEFCDGIYTGRVASPERIKEFIAKAREAGSDKIMAEMQKQIDAWKAQQK